ncbi:hypothetical protein [Vibrio cyclitrophicus]|uniref:hypothetical protein n=1 Tax=Vibrio cyclitrophicus TaxID=47951 RepID=UPI00148D23A5|nr:hypothetical protein [Vibrio cyclitrophicus]NOH19468.1 hypothetical protein [Vibrio cyclitrophicus]
MKSLSNNYRIAVIDYSATGEGRHIFIKTGTDESVRKEVGEWLYQGADVYTAEQWLELDKITTQSSDEQKAKIDTLKFFAPALWQAMNQRIPMLVNIEYHWNES